MIRLPKGLPETPIDLVYESYADNESWILKASEDGTFTIKNLNFPQDSFAVAPSSITSDKGVSGSAGSHWKKEDSAVTIHTSAPVVVLLAWEATVDGYIVLRNRDPANVKQNFTFVPA